MLKILSAFIGVATLATLTRQVENTPPAPAAPAPRTNPTAIDAGNEQDRLRRENENSVATDNILSATLLVREENLVAIAHLGQQHSQTESVRGQAQSLGEAHGRIRQHLQESSSGYGAGPTESGLHQNPVTSSGSTGTFRETDTRPNSDSRASRSLASPADHIQLARELGGKSYESMSNDLLALQGVDFDRAFVAVEIACLRETIDTMTVYQNYASTSLRNAIESDLPLLKKDLARLKLLAHDLAPHGQ